MRTMDILSNKEIAEGVLSYRKQNGLTQADMATRLGISRNYLSLIERGVVDNITLNVYRAICRYVSPPQAYYEMMMIAKALEDLATGWRGLPDDLKAMIETAVNEAT